MIVIFVSKQVYWLPAVVRIVSYEFQNLLGVVHWTVCENKDLAHNPCAGTGREYKLQGSEQIQASHVSLNVFDPATRFCDVIADKGTTVIEKTFQQKTILHLLLSVAIYLEGFL